MNDQPERYQCCDNCTTPKYIFTLKDGSIIPVCEKCYDDKALREVSKGFWNMETGDYQEFLKLEVAL